MLVDQHLAAHHIRSACELRLPKVVRENNHWVRTRRPVILVLKDPSQRRAHSEHREVSARNDFSGSGLVVSACREVHSRKGTAENAFEKAVLQLKVAADRVRHQIPTAEPVGYLISLPIDEDKAFGLADRKPVQEYLIDERVDGRGCSNAECQR